MANTDTPFGLKPLRHRSGAPYNGAARPYYVVAGDGTALFIGDPVVKTGSSNASQVLGHPPGTLPTVVRATAGATNQITGIVVGVESEQATDPVYRAASTARVVWVADDPSLVFEVQDDGGGTLTEDVVGLNANVIFTTAGSTITARSGAEINGATPAADATFQFTIQGLSRAEGNVLGDFAKWEVTINLHTERLAAVAGV